MVRIPRSSSGVVTLPDVAVTMTSPLASMAELAIYAFILLKIVLIPTAAPNPMESFPIATAPAMLCISEVSTAVREICLTGSADVSITELLMYDAVSFSVSLYATDPATPSLPPPPNPAHMDLVFPEVFADRLIVPSEVTAESAMYDFVVSAISFCV